MHKMPRMWDVLTDKSGGPSAIVVPVHTPPIEALIELIHTYCGNVYSADNPVLVAEAEGLKVEWWYSCTKAWREAEGAPDMDTWDWWAPHGDGKRSISVVSVDRSIYVLDEMAAEAEPAEVAK
jgi:hypothetical protein